MMRTLAMTSLNNQQAAAACAATIRTLNDAFRRNPAASRLMLTAGVQALPQSDRLALLAAVMIFGDFNASNDPYNEHDFGALDRGDVSYFWKIDYYDRDFELGSPDPADPHVTRRVLTIMRADEY
jgi:hypothetical protein